jgi:hypothetical protein
MIEMEKIYGLRATGQSTQAFPRSAEKNYENRSQAN